MYDLNDLIVKAADLLGPLSNDEFNDHDLYRNGVVDLVTQALLDTIAAGSDRTGLDPESSVWRNAIEHSIDALRSED